MHNEVGIDAVKYSRETLAKKVEVRQNAKVRMDFIHILDIPEPDRNLFEEWLELMVHSGLTEYPMVDYFNPFLYAYQKDWRYWLMGVRKAN